MRKGGKPSGKSRTVFSELSSQLTEEHTWCFGLCTCSNQIQTRLCFQCFHVSHLDPVQLRSWCTGIPTFKASLASSLLHALLESSSSGWRNLANFCVNFDWFGAGSKFLTAKRKKPPRWLRGGAKANWAKWMLFWEICRPDVEYVEPVDIIAWCFVHLYPANKRSGGNNFRPRSCNYSKPFKLKTTPFDPGILQPMGSWISMRYGK